MSRLQSSLTHVSLLRILQNNFSSARHEVQKIKLIIDIVKHFLVAPI